VGVEVAVGLGEFVESDEFRRLAHTPTRAGTDRRQ
jgi:hypothetical protein